MSMAPFSEDAVFGYNLVSQEEASTSLSLAVRIIDELTLKPVAGPARLRIREGAVRPVKNAGGDYLFFNLIPALEHTLEIRADSYEPKEVMVTIPDHTGLNALTPLQLIEKFLIVISVKKKIIT